jgi:hypothetical protein
MSYLDVPRLHFSGDFYADPATANNERGNYDPAARLDPGWNHNGKNWFFLQGCTVRSVVDGSGAVRRATAGDALVGGRVESTNSPTFAKIVDLDPEFQVGSQIWGLEVQASAASGGGCLRGRMRTATLRDLWTARAPGGFAKGFGGSYQSVLTDLNWEPASKSPVLEELRHASPTTLSIKFVTYAYDAVPGSPRFNQGRVVGTIGPARPGEPEHFVAARRATDAGSGAFGPVPFKVDTTRNVVVFDLGNAVPEVVAAGARRPLGTMQAVILTRPVVALGPIDYSQAHYETSAGIEEVGALLVQAPSLAVFPIGITASTVAGGLVLAERPSGLYVDATEVAWRMDPGTTRSVDLVASWLGLGRVAAGRTLGLRLGHGAPASALSFPASVTTGANGRARVEFRAHDPGKPRGRLDGQYYRVDYFDGSPSPSNRLGALHVRVFDAHPTVNSPTWAHVRPIFEHYARLYPFMKGVLDLSDPKIIRRNRAAVQRTLAYPEEDPRYMPVTRDLSRDKRELLLRWLSQGAR